MRSFYKVFIGLICLLFPFFSSTQTEIQWSELQKSNGLIGEVLPLRADQFYTTRYSNNAMMQTIFLARHTNFKVDYKGKIKLNVGNSMASFVDLRILNNEAYVFLEDKMNGKHQLFCQKYSEECKPEGKARLLAEYPLVRSLGKSGYFSILQSKNRKFLSVEYQLQSRKEEHELFSYKIFSNQFELISEGEYESPYVSRLAEFSNHFLSNTGDYFLACKVFEQNERGRVQDAFSLKKVLIMHVKQDELEEFELEFDGRKIVDMRFSSDDNRILTFTGLYGEGMASVTGIFYFRLDFDQQEVLDDGFEPFERDFITQDWSEKEKEHSRRMEERGKGGPSLYDFDIREIVTIADGSIIGMLEQFYTQTYTSSDVSNRLRSTTYYHFNDIILYKVSPQGIFSWIQKIPKNQISINDGGYFSSVARYITDSTMYMYFNDHRLNYDNNGNWNKERNPTSYRKKSNCLAFATINLNTGTVDRQNYFSREETDALAVPGKFVSDYPNNELILVLQDGRKEKFGVVRF
jgi:hypothetical protein